MARSKVVLGLVLLGCLATCAVASFPVQIAPDGTCKVLDANNKLIGIVRRKALVSNLPALNGGRQFNCVGNINGTGAVLPNPPSVGYQNVTNWNKALSGRSCNADGITTDNWSSSVSSNGIFTLSCTTPRIGG